MKVWALAEAAGSGPALGTAPLLAHARRLGVGVTVFSVTPGGLLAGPRVAAAMAARIDSGDVPDAALFALTHDGRDAAGRLSARIDRPVIVGTDVVLVDGRLCVDTPVLGGETVVRTAFTGPPPHLVILRGGGASDADSPGGTEHEVDIASVAADPPGDTGRARVVGFHPDDDAEVGLEQAAVVVAGGRGIGSAAGFGQLREMARLLGGATGATRAAVDQGLAPDAWLVGQSGRTVRPRVYLAFGISGASHHLAGTSGAEHVIAVNSDRQAPIFEVADLGVVGDAGAVVTRLLSVLRARSGTAGDDPQNPP